MDGEFVRPQKSDQAVGPPLVAVMSEENDRRRPDQPEAFEQRLILGVVGRDVGLQENGFGERSLHVGIGIGVARHLFAAHAPVGVKILHRGLARGLRGLQLLIESVYAFDAYEAQAWLGGGGAAGAGSE